MAVEKLASYYGEEKMLNPIRVEMKAWCDDENIGGAPVACLPPGVLTQVSEIRKPEGRIHWAGTEMALISQGYMDGAIESGIRAAN